MNKNRHFKEARNINAESGIEATMKFINAPHNVVDIKVDNMTLTVFPVVARKTCEEDHLQYVKGVDDLCYKDVDWSIQFSEYDLLATVKRDDVGIWEEKLERVIHAKA